uniref:Uncharacterized protein n=1 Tax=Cacopsylla melanoneura TaxID=428564 RepID=A0A8D8WTV9_9HEMI
MRKYFAHFRLKKNSKNSVGRYNTTVKKIFLENILSKECNPSSFRVGTSILRKRRVSIAHVCFLIQPACIPASQRHLVTEGNKICLCRLKTVLFRLMLVFYFAIT